MNVVVFNVKFSPNLGDGIIAACLETELKRHLGHASITNLDLAGRVARPDISAGTGRTAILRLLHQMPSRLRELTVETMIRLQLAWRVRGAWNKVLKDADVAVVGGGHLIQDEDLNFPVKLATVAAQCRRYHVPVALYGVGVAEQRSARGAALLSRLWQANTMVFAGARDAASARRLEARRAGNVVITPDPGLLASRLWPPSPRPSRLRPRVGVGITHPLILRNHARHVRIRDEEALELYRGLLGGLLEANYDVVCFTNGAHEDQSFLNMVCESYPSAGPRLGPRLGPSLGPRLDIAQACSDPADLARLIQTFDLVVAHRLHACIVAYSYAIPHIGLNWDAKLADFFAGVDRAPFLVEFDAAQVPLIPALVKRALQAGICDDKREQVLGDARASIEQLALSLTKCSAGKRRAESSIAAGHLLQARIEP